MKLSERQLLLLSSMALLGSALSYTPSFGNYSKSYWHLSTQNSFHRVRKDTVNALISKGFLSVRQVSIHGHREALLTQKGQDFLKEMEIPDEPRLL